MTLPRTFERRRLDGRTALALAEARADGWQPDLTAPNPHHAPCPRCRVNRTRGVPCTTPGCRTMVP